jgi:hypothetical protein
VADHGGFEYSQPFEDLFAKTDTNAPINAHFPAIPYGLPGNDWLLLS